MVPVPEMGDSISEGTIVQWTKDAGEVVEEDDVVVILETDKVSGKCSKHTEKRLLSHVVSCCELRAGPIVR